MKDADVVVMDAQYTFMESQQKLDWGHSAANTAVDIASEAGVKNLVLFHHEPTYDDFKIDSIHEESNTYSDALGADIEKIEVAYEGLEINL
jgi:ribonuclease BN (tRNA processing enzyme)